MSFEFHWSGVQESAVQDRLRTTIQSILVMGRRMADMWSLEEQIMVKAVMSSS